MASADNLMGLGMPNQIAARLGVHIALTSAEGATAGAAKQIPGRNGVYIVTSGASGVVLPQVGGDGAGKGILLGDEVQIANISGSALVIFAAANSGGSVVVFYGRGVSTVGTTGISISTGITAYFKPITTSIWIFEASI